MWSEGMHKIRLKPKMKIGHCRERKRSERGHIWDQRKREWSVMKVRSQLEVVDGVKSGVILCSSIKYIIKGQRQVHIVNRG